MSIITNFQNLAKNDLRKKALEIAEAGYEAIDIEKVVKNRIKIENNILKVVKISTIPGNDVYREVEINLNNFKRIFIVGIGKGSAMASLTLAEILGDKLTGGIALDIQKPKLEIRNLKLEIFAGSHPFPSKQNIEATKKIIELADELNENDLLINFICGGGSALTCVSERELEDSMKATKLLTKAGATIEELNTVRKHLSEFKGGGFAKIVCPATAVSLIVSDVCGNDLSIVASGPTVFDKTTILDAENVFKKYGLNLKDFSLHEVPKDKKCFDKVHNILFVCNQDAIMGMLRKSEELGLKSEIYSLALRGEAREALLQMAEKINDKDLLIAAGETTVNLNKYKAIGKGGRNQEAVLGAISNKQSVISNNLVIVSFASDAHDNTEAAGAIGDSLTLEKAKELNLNIEDFLETHNSFNFFEKTDDLIFAEQKCFNVADLMVVLKLSE